LTPETLDAFGIDQGEYLTSLSSTD
jgi:hypothetical protein